MIENIEVTMKERIHSVKITSVYLFSAVISLYCLINIVGA